MSRLELLEWGAKRFGDVDVGTSFTDLVPQLLSCMNDKDSKVLQYIPLLWGIVCLRHGYLLWF